MKIAFIIFTSKFLSNNEGIMKKNRYFYYYMIIVGFIFGLILLQPDFGSGIVMISAIIIMSLMSKIKFKNFIYIGLLGVFAIVIMLISEPYRIERIIAYIDPFSDPLGSGFQIIQSLFALSP